MPNNKGKLEKLKIVGAVITSGSIEDVRGI
jgi:hypothetical protein